LQKNEKLASVFLAMQLLYPDTQVELTLDNDRKVKLQPVDATDWFSPTRVSVGYGLFFSTGRQHRGSTPFRRERDLGSLTMVVKFLQS